MQINSAQQTLLTSVHLTNRACTCTTCLLSGPASETTCTSSFLAKRLEKLVQSEREIEEKITLSMYGWQRERRGRERERKEGERKTNIILKC